MGHRKVCKHCGGTEEAHHDYEPSMPEGCVCPPGDWGSVVSDVCDKYTGRGQDCARCQHDEECHKGPNALGNRRAAFGASVLTDVLCGNGTEVGAGDTAKGTT